MGSDCTGINSKCFHRKEHYKIEKQDSNSASSFFVSSLTRKQDTNPSSADSPSSLTLKQGVVPVF